jgi:hypothetical protein
LKGEGLKEGEQLPKEVFTEPIYKGFEDQGATNILMLDEPAERNGLKGLKLKEPLIKHGKLYDYMVICLSMASPCKVPGRKYKG